MNNENENTGEGHVDRVVILRQDKKLICIDYDGTFTSDPKTFSYAIHILQQAGFEVIGCTMRYENEVDEGFNYFRSVVDKTYFTGRKAKKPFLESQNIYPKIWIDDMPEWIFKDAV